MIKKFVLGWVCSTITGVYAHPSELETELSVSFSFALFSSSPQHANVQVFICEANDGFEKPSPFTIFQAGVFRPQTVSTSEQ